MHYPTIIKNEIDNYINITFKGKLHLIGFFKHHERRPVLENNILKELKQSETVLTLSNRSNEQKRKLIKQIVTEVTRMFCKIAIENFEAQHSQKIMRLSDIGKDEHPDIIGV